MEQRQQAYFNLIQTLIQCPDGTEADILKAHPELVDAGLVMMLHDVAQMMTEQQDADSVATIDWLTSFASELATDLGLDPESSMEVQLDSGLNFLLTTFQAIAESNSNPKVIYPLFRDNLPQLDESLIPILVTWHQAKFDEVDEDSRQFFAAVLNAFANLIQQFPLGSRIANLEIAIACYQLALEVYTRAAYPEDWARTQMNLAVAHSDRIRGERAANLEMAIACYRLSLEFYSRAAFPEDWARTQMNLAVAYSDRIRGSRAKNLEESLVCYQLALDVYTRDAYPEDWARTQMNLAIAYSNRIHGDRAANLEEAIASSQLALEVRTREAYPEQWAVTQLNLAVAYQTRIRGDRAANLEESISCYRMALEVYTRAAYPEQWATTQMNLANAYGNRIQGDRAANLEESLACYRIALEIHTRAAYPEQWATTQNNLAKAFQERIYGERAANLERAIESSRLGLEVYTRAAYPERWATTQNNLGNIYTDLDRVDEAIHCFQSALEIRTPESLLIDCLTTARNLGNLAFKQGNWQLAIDSYDLAIQAVETSRSWATSDDGRQEILRQALSIYENVIQSCINLGRIERAIEYSERVRSRQIVDLMATADLYQGGEISDEIKLYLAEYESLERQIYSYRFSENNELISSNRAGSILDIMSLDRVSLKIKQLESQKQSVFQKIRQFDPILAEQKQVMGIDFSTIKTLITNSDTAILSFYTTDDDTHIFIVTRDREPQIHTCIGQGWQNFQLWLQEQWLIPYAERRSDWISTFPAVLIEISQRLEIDSLVEKLNNISELIIIPHLLLHQISFAALPISRETGDELLSDRFTIHYVPSCQILKYCQERPIVKQVQYGIVEDADGTLPGAIFECQRVSEIFQIDDRYHLEGKQKGTVEKFNALLRDSSNPVTTLHLAHHAQSRLDDPLESSLLFVDGNITLGRLMMSRYPSLDEVFLSCCETAIGTITITDDILTLATGFLCAGARSVIGTLWCVSDLVTPLFAIFYYEYRHDGHSRSQSLTMAQVRLRNISGKEFDLNYRGNLERFLKAYARSIQVGRKNLEKQIYRGEINNNTYDWEFVRLTRAYHAAVELFDSLDRYCQADRPFAHPYYWAAFTCQGLG